jgi:hypothetical protein
MVSAFSVGCLAVVSACAKPIIAVHIEMHSVNIRFISIKFCFFKDPDRVKVKQVLITDRNNPE